MWWSFWRQRRRNDDLDEEIAHDLMLETEERVRSGMPAQDAERSSRKEFGNVLLVKEVTREMWGWTSLEILAQDLRYATRTLRNSPGFAATAIICFARRAPTQ